LWASFAVVFAIFLFATFVSRAPRKAEEIDSTHQIVTSHPLAVSTIIIQLPVAVQLFISPDVLQNRSELDRAIVEGRGVRLLPDKELVVT